MKNTLLPLLFLFTFSLAMHAQFMPGTFYSDVGNYYQKIGTSPCVVDSSFYVIRYGGVQALHKEASYTVRYHWDRFYNSQVICKGPSSTLMLLKSNKIYQYFPREDSMVYTSSGIPGPSIKDVAASPTSAWCINNFNQIAKYDTGGWHIYTLGGSFNPTRILAASDTCVYLTDKSSVRVYNGQSLSAPIYTFTTATDFNDWALDNSGNVWAAADQGLLFLSPTGSTLFFSQANLTSMYTNEFFTHVAADGLGKIYASTSSERLYTSSGSGFGAPQAYYGLTTIGADRFTPGCYVLTYDSITMLNISSPKTVHFGNMPYQNIQAVSPDQMATDQGIFTYNSYQEQVPTSFVDTALFEYANDVTCFVSGNYGGNNNNLDHGYGTHHGVFHTNAAVNNSALPDTNITCLYYNAGSYFIGTEKGLCIYNQVVYTTFDTATSPLPSNKITFITSYQSPFTSQQELWIGTDKGLALYTGGVWTVYDSSLTGISDLYVTGILPCPYYYMSSDSTVWVSTLGHGLIKLHRDGRYTAFNTTAGGFPDDSLYYVIQTPGCEFVGNILLGTGHHGVSYFSANGSTFSFDTLIRPYNSNNTVHLHNSKLYTQISYYFGQTMMVTDMGLLFIGRCVGVSVDETRKDAGLYWHQDNDNSMQISLPGDMGAGAEASLYDIAGRHLLSDKPRTAADKKINMDIWAPEYMCWR